MRLARTRQIPSAFQVFCHQLLTTLVTRCQCYKLFTVVIYKWAIVA
jgi:hypothetical protein